MLDDQTFRLAVELAVLLHVGIYYRVRSQASGERGRRSLPAPQGTPVGFAFRTSRRTPRTDGGSLFGLAEAATHTFIPEVTSRPLRSARSFMM